MNVTIVDTSHRNPKWLPDGLKKSLASRDTVFRETIASIARTKLQNRVNATRLHPLTFI